MSNSHDGPTGTRRPLLAGGEQLLSAARTPPKRPGSFNPYTPAMAFTRLKPQALALSTGVTQMPEGLATERLVLEATLFPNFIAASHFPEQTLARHHLHHVGTRPAKGPYRTEKQFDPSVATKTLLLAGTERSFQAFASEVMQGPSGSALDWEEMTRFESLRLPDPFTILRGMRPDLPRDQFITWDAVLGRLGNSAVECWTLRTRALEKLRLLVEGLGGEIDLDHLHDVDGLTYVPIWIDVTGAERVAAFNPLRAIRPMPKLRPTPISPLRAMPGLPFPAPPPGTAPRTDETIAVFDGGIGKIAALAPFTTQVELTPEPPTDEGLDHGSTVTAALLYGPRLHRPGAGGGRPMARVHHFRVFPPPSTDRFDSALPWTLGAIERTLATGKYRLVNLSVGPDECVDDGDVPHRWTAVVDRLVRDYEVTIVAAVGNNGLEDEALGFNRVQPPGDMVNGIGVGACETAGDEAPVRAAYSAKGPGRDGQRVQPVGVQFGGSERQLFSGINRTGRIVPLMGTSFAAPLVTHGIAELAGALGPQFSPAVARAFCVHFAARASRDHKPLDVGHGRLPLSYARALECAPNECVVLYRASLVRGSLTAMELPLPADLDDHVPIRIDWTLAFTADTDAADAVEYTRDGLDLKFRPNQRRVRVKDAATGEMLVELDVERDRAQLETLASQRAILVSDIPVSDPTWRAKGSETAQRAAGKWETLLRGRMPEREAGTLYRPRLDVNYLRREGGVLVGRNVRPLEFVMLVTVRAPEGVTLYDRVANQFQMLTPLQTTLRATG